MNITLIGTGNVATVLGRKLNECGHTIVQVLSRNQSAAGELAQSFGAVEGDLKQPILAETDFIIIAVPDQFIELVASQLIMNDHAILLHTAGSISMQILEKYTTRFGVFYPLQTLRKEALTIPEIPILIEANKLEVLKEIKALAVSISEKVVEADAIDRQQIHVAAVWVNNFTNHINSIAFQFCQEKGLDFTLLHPLVMETTRKIMMGNPAIHQTGPAKRGDASTMKQQITAMNHHPDWQELYRMLSDSIQKHQR